jgi:hypothetical protein
MDRIQSFKVRHFLGVGRSEFDIAAQRSRTTADMVSGDGRGVARDDHLWKNCGKTTNSE